MASPDPGTRREEIPLPWPTARISSNGQNAIPLAVSPGKGRVRYGAVELDFSTSRNTDTPLFPPTASIPRPEYAREDEAFRIPQVRTSLPHILPSHNLTVPSIPHVAVYLPALFSDGSTAMPVTGPRCARSLTCGVVMFGDQSVIVPFACPRWIIPECEFWAIECGEPRWVGI